LWVWCVAVINLNTKLIMYEATIYFDTYEDSFENGEMDKGTSWVEKLEGKTIDELKEAICDITYCKAGDLYLDNCNDYDYANEYFVSYLANERNEGLATEKEVKAWQKGKYRLWSVCCHILVSEITRKPAEL